MLQKMHDGIQGWIAWTIGGLLAATFVFTGVHGIFGRRERLVAKVDRAEITLSEFARHYERAKLVLTQYGLRNLDRQMLNRFKKQLLDYQIKNIIVRNLAKRLGLTISPKEIYQAILNSEAFKEDGVFSRERYQQVVRGFFGSEKAVLDDVLFQKLEQQLKYSIQESGFMLPFEMALKEQAQKQKRDFRVIEFPTTEFKDKVTINDDAVKSYYEAHQSDFMLPRKVSLQYLQLKRSDLEQEVVVNLDEARAFYTENQPLFTAARNWKVVKYSLPKDLSGDDLKAAILSAKKLPKGVVATKLKLVADDAKQAKLIQLVSALQVGEIAKYSDAKEGDALFRVVEIIEPQLAAFDKVQTKATKLCKEQKVARIYAEQQEELKNLLYTYPESLDEVARKLNKKLVKTELFAERDQFKPGIVADKAVFAAAFSDTVLNGYNSEPLRLNDGSIVVLRLAQLVPEHVKPLSEVATGIKEQLILIEAEKLAENAAHQLAEELNAGKKIAAKELEAKKLRVKSYKEVDSRGSKVHSKLVATAFELPWRSTLSKAVATTVKIGDNWMVLQLEKVTPNRDPLADDYDRELSDQVYSGEEFRKLVNSAVEHAQVKIYTENLDLV